MNYAPVSGNNFGRLHPLVFGEIGGYVNVFVFVLIACCDCCFGNGEDHVGFDMPAVLVPRGGRQVPRIAFRRAAFHPRYDGGNLLIREPRVIDVIADVWVCVPRRHLALDYGFTNGRRPRPRVLICQQ